MGFVVVVVIGLRGLFDLLVDGVGVEGVRVEGVRVALAVAVDVFVILVPGVAFDDRGRRLGRGAGYYDRYLASYQARRRRPLVAAVCFSCQVVEEVPCEAHDMRMDAVLTPGEVLFGEGAAE